MPTAIGIAEGAPDTLIPRLKRLYFAADTPYHRDDSFISEHGQVAMANSRFEHAARIDAIAPNARQI